MSDRTCATATIHFCPPHRRRGVLKILVSHGLDDETPEADGTTAEGVTVGEAYVCHEIPCGSAAECVDDLIHCAPEVAFTIYEDPAYEWVGTVWIYVPGLGLFVAACDTSGEPMFTQQQVLALESGPDEVRRAGLGVPWRDAIAALSEHDGAASAGTATQT